MICLCCWDASWPARQLVTPDWIDWCVTHRRPSTECCVMPLVPSAHLYPLRRFVRTVLRLSLLVACVLLCMSGASAGQRAANEMSADPSTDLSLPSVNDLVTLGNDPPGTTEDPRAQDQAADGGARYYRVHTQPCGRKETATLSWPNSRRSGAESTSTTEF